MPKTYTVKEVADILGFSTNSIYTFLKEKRIKGVRIGKGRFRIPEEELKRILHLSKNPQAERVVSAEQILPPQGTLIQSGDAAFIIPRTVTKRYNDKEVLTPNIFDWFVGLSAVIAGTGLFLFNSSVTSPELAKLALLYPIIRIVLIATGTGVIISGLLAQNRIWHKVFLFALSFMGFINSFGLARSGDIEGALLYAGMALVIGVSMVIPFGGVVFVLIYASFIALCFPAVILFFSSDMHVELFVTLLGMPHTVVGLLAAVVAVVAVGALWIGYAGNRGALIIATAFVAICDIALAVWYANLQFWSRSFFMVVIGYFTALLPYWWPLQQQVSRRYRVLLHGMFVVIGGVLLMAVFVVNLLQHNVWMAREAEFRNKIKIAQSELNSGITSVQSSLVVAAANADFVDAIIKPDFARLTANAKIIYESNPNIRRLVFLDAKGNGIALYPYGTFDEPNLAFREYFHNPKETGKPFVSDVFQAKGDHSGRQVIVVSVPLRDKKGAFAGVMTASIDLDRLGLQLGQIAADRQGEYFVVTDSKGKILIHPDSNLVGTTVPETDPITKGIRGEFGVMHSVLINKFYGMIAYADVPQLHWAISLRAKSTDIFVLTSLTILGVFGTVILMLLTAIFVIAIIRNRARYEKAGGP